MAITLTGTRITVEFQDGDPKGDSWDDPFTLDDVVTDIANVTKQGNQIYIPYSLYIIDADTYFLAENMQVYFPVETQDDYYKLYVSDCHFRSQGTEGMYWYCKYNSSYSRISILNGFFDIKNTVFSNFRYCYFGGSANKNMIIEDSAFYKMTYLFLPYNNNVEVSDIMIAGNSEFSPCADFADVEGIKILNNLIGVYLYVFSGAINCELRIKNCTNNIKFRPLYSDQIANLTNSKINVDSYNINSYGIGDITLNLISTFKINIENGDGGTAKLYDKDDNLIWTEALSGELEKAVTYYKHYVETDGMLVADEKTTYEPFKLVVSKANYLDLTIPNITIEPGEETHITGKIVKPTYYHQAISGKVEVSEVTGKVTVEDEISGTVN